MHWVVILPELWYKAYAVIMKNKSTIKIRVADNEPRRAGKYLEKEI